MYSNRRLRVGLAAALVAALAASGCGADSADSASPASTTSADTETAADDQPGTTTAGSGSSSAALTAGSVTNDDDVTASWSLTADSDQLCFEATLDHDDPVVAETLGAGVAECITPDGGSAAMDDSLSVSVGVVDGQRTFGYLWGRVDAGIDTLTIHHEDNSQTVVDLVEGPDGSTVFAVVLDTTKVPPVASLDAASGAQIEDSEPIRDFLRAGPTYPTTPTSTTTVPDVDLYPTN